MIDQIAELDKLLEESMDDIRDRVDEWEITDIKRIFNLQKAVLGVDISVLKTLLQKDAKFRQDLNVLLEELREAKLYTYSDKLRSILASNNMNF